MRSRRRLLVGGVKVQYLDVCHTYGCFAPFLSRRFFAPARCVRQIYNYPRCEVLYRGFYFDVGRRDKL